MVSGAETTSKWPNELKLGKDKRLLTISFDDGASYSLTAEYLRISSPSAEVKGHTPAERKLVHGKINVAISALQPIGNYAVQIVFDDGHDTGYYDWNYLHMLGAEQDERWAAYLTEMEQKHLRREPLFPGV